MSNLEKAIEIAKKAHFGQTDKSGKPYIDHPLRVMGYLNSELEKIVAVLHDLFEDTKVTAQDLLKYGFSEQVIELLTILTRKKDEKYMDFIQRISLNEIATRIKLADLKDNMDTSRVSENLKEWHQGMCNKRYNKAKAFLEMALLNHEKLGITNNKLKLACL